MSQKYEKLKMLLRELFRLDQPDLDFGLYRVLHAKSVEVSQFLEKDLLPQVKTAFDQYKNADKAELEKELTQVISGIAAAGMDPGDSPKVKELRAKRKNDAVDIGTLESEVYDHLYSFFRRYYSEGDFLAKRVYKPGVYAIPYEGEEVMLHWANKDQHYVKTSEYLRDYAFRLRPGDKTKPMRVHFRLVDAAEGEHGNVKAAEGKDRVFVLAAPGDSGDAFIAEEDVERGKELVIRFESRPATLADWPVDERNGKKKPPVQKDLSRLAAERVLIVTDAALAEWIAELGKPHVMASGELAEYSRLDAHLKRYVARNTFDYFIHKDLGTFLSRELDFYIKNEVMHLDDVENETAPRVEQYLSKIRVIRKIATKIIDFLAQIEDFQKKLWLKKKFVVETQYCITLDLVPEELLSEVVANEAQRDEWIRLFAINEIGQDIADSIPYSTPLSIEFCRRNGSFPVHTKHFDPGFTVRLLNSYSDLSALLSGTLVHGENFQAFGLLERRFSGKVDLLYIDPPYNTGQDEFRYKDNYPHSSWLSLIRNRIDRSLLLLQADGVFACSLNDEETFRAGVMIDGLSPRLARLGEFVWRTRNTDNRVLTRLSVDHEYIHVFAGRGTQLEGRVIDRSDFKNSDRDPRGPYTTDPLTGKANAQDRANLHYLIVNPDTGVEYLPHPDFGWITDKAGFDVLLRDKRVYWPKTLGQGTQEKRGFSPRSRNARLCRVLRSRSSREKVTETCPDSLERSCSTFRSQCRSCGPLSMSARPRMALLWISLRDQVRRARPLFGLIETRTARADLFWWRWAITLMSFVCRES